MSTKILELETPFDCPYRYLKQYPILSYTEWIAQNRPGKVWMWFCGLKSGIVCSNSKTFCNACPLEDAA